VASGTGLFFAQNMMYLHTIAVYDRDYQLVATIDDSVDLGAFPLTGRTEKVRGGPVEAAFTHDGRYAYVSNYSMFGPGFSRPGDDVCSPSQNLDSSFVYRVDASSLAVDQVIPVGSVPKYVAVSPDDRLVLVSNWCSYSLSVIDAATGKELSRVPLGAYPRGIAITADSATAYVAVMGTRDVAVVDLATFSVDRITGVGSGPRHLVLDPRGEFLYATLNGESRIAKIDLASRTVVTKVSTGSAPRSMAIAPDGGALYVVNYESNTMSKVRTRDMQVLQTLPTDRHPIGITSDTDGAGVHRVWVACYAGSLIVFKDA
jgi:YVTN family beta-propeller protein